MEVRELESPRVLGQLLFKNHFIYLFLATVGLCCCSGFSPVATEWGLLSSCGARASLRGGFSRGAQALGYPGVSGCRTRV